MHSMSRIITRALLLTALLAGPGCVLTPEIVGETLSISDSGASEDSLSTTGEDPGATVTTAQDDTASPPSGVYGSPCDLQGFPPVLNYTAISPQPACDDGICLLVIDGKYQCTDDGDCEANVGAGSVCDEGDVCDVAPAVLLEDARCTRTCELDEDCPAIPGCTSGATCSPMVVSGELCCQKVCACKDSLYLSGVMSLQMVCDENPEFCA